MTSAVRKWSTAMARCGAEVIVAHDGGVTSPVDENVKWIGVRHAGHRGLRFPIGIRDLLKETDLLVLHSGWTFRNIRTAAAARALGIPYVLEPRGAYDPHIVRRKKWLKRAWWAAWEKQLVMQARAIHIFFEPQQEHLRMLGYEGPVIIASNGREMPGTGGWAGGDGGYILWLGRFDPEHKGLDTLLKAVEATPEGARPKLRLHGPDWRRRKRLVERWIADMRLGDSVTVGQAVYGEEKLALLMGAAGFVYPSRWDACPNSVLESVALSVPTLVTDYPLGRYLAERGGALLAEGTVEGLAAGLTQLREASAAELGRVGAEVVRKELEWDKVAKSWLDQAQRLL